MYTKEEVHSFNVWTTIMQSLNIKEWKLFKLQITQTRPPFVFRMEKMSKFNNRKKCENIYQMCTK